MGTPIKKSTMTPQQFMERMLELRNTWADDSKNETNQTKLFEFCETFIDGMEEALEDSGNHPTPPPPRVR